MRRTASTVSILIAVWVATALPTIAVAEEQCRFDPKDGQIVCTVSGGDVKPDGTDPQPKPVEVQYLYTSTAAGIGDCYYWSRTPGGLDSSDPASDAAVIGIVTSMPACPSITPVDSEGRAWEVFRSWDLDPPDPVVTPPVTGITGMPVFIEAVPPDQIVHAEVLPDGRTLSVRARPTTLSITWGDGVRSSHLPRGATGHPDGVVSHTYRLKTCTKTYRERHPSGELCHPTLDHYEIASTYVWTGEYSVGAGWSVLGTLNRATSDNYEVDEARGVNVP